MLKQNVTFIHSEGIQTEHTKIHSRTPNEMYNYQLLLYLKQHDGQNIWYLVIFSQRQIVMTTTCPIRGSGFRKCLLMKKCIFFPNFGLASTMLTYFLKHIFKNSSKPATETILTNGARFTQECANSCQNKLRGLPTYSDGIFGFQTSLSSD